MGLDQFAYIKFPGDLETEDSDVNRVYLMTWRKHPNLQGWMERLWRRRNNTIEQFESDTLMGCQFNCVELQLDLEDVEKLEKDVEANNLNESHQDTTGFFFGDNSDEEYKFDDLKFCRNARAAIKNGLTVCYNSWW